MTNFFNVAHSGLFRISEAPLAVFVAFAAREVV